ncbi:MAG: hypothetical protein CBD18_06090 [Opitutales bacterium TMED158]|nr:MAG: hypothetical protein CBD18_06090 [Opitutales bacterium TMED158]
MKKTLFIALGAVAIAVAFLVSLQLKKGQRVALIIETHLLPAPSAKSLHPELARRIVELNERTTEGSDPIDALAKLGRLYHANGYLNHAWQTYRILIELDRTNPLWPHRLASIVSSFGQLDDALPLYATSIELDPDYLPSRILLGDTYFKLNRFEEATDVFQRVLEKDSANSFALFGQARVALAQADIAQARRLLEAARRFNNRIGGDLLADIYERQGETQKARALLHEITWSSHVNISDPWVDDIVSDCYDSFEVAMAAGKAGRAGDTAGAIRLLEKAVRLDSLDHNAHNHLAELYLAQKSVDQAVKAYQNCTKIAPTFWEGWAGLISIAWNSGDHAKATELIDQAIALCPDSYVINNYKGDSLITENRPQEAIPYFEKTTRLVPENAVGYNYLARAYISLGQSEKAHEQLLRALEAEPTNPLSLKLICLYYIVEADQPKAEQYMDRAFRSPRFSEADLGNLQGMFDKRFK